MVCKDPEGCKEKSKEYSLANACEIEIGGQEEFNKLKEVYATKGLSCLGFSKHAQQRMLERAISETELRTIIFDGDIIEYHQNEFGTTKMVVWGHIRISSKKYRPLHIILKKRANDSKYSVVTLYDPRTEAWRWDENYTKRICFCVAT
jgi:hypothetical protein